MRRSDLNPPRIALSSVVLGALIQSACVPSPSSSSCCSKTAKAGAPGEAALPSPDHQHALTDDATPLFVNGHTGGAATRAPAAPAAPTGACAGKGALSTCLTKTKDDAYYLEQARKYFDSLAGNKPLFFEGPNYSRLAARWEWPPWINLTGFGEANLSVIDNMIKLYDRETRVKTLDCHVEAVQPFVRCHVVLVYGGKDCPIYEEFTYNSKGETTFVEAWSMRSDLPRENLAPGVGTNRWGTQADAHRMSTKIPGLGTSTGLIDIEGSAMAAVAETDPEVDGFRKRADNFFPYIIYELQKAGGVDKAFAAECGWPTTATSAPVEPRR